MLIGNWKAQKQQIFVSEPESEHYGKPVEITGWAGSLLKCRINGGEEVWLTGAALSFKYMAQEGPLVGRAVFLQDPIHSREGTLTGHRFTSVGSKVVSDILPMSGVKLAKLASELVSV